MVVKRSLPTALESVPYGAPLAIREPSAAWIHYMSLLGSNNTFATVPRKDLTGKWVLISGGNNGIGREAAIEMSSWGANLILACRNPPKTEIHPTQVVKECLAAAARNGKDVQVEWWEVDMASIASVDALAKRWNATGRPLDILCNNAGVGSSIGGNDVFITKDGFEFIHQINLLSHVLLTLSLLPSLAAAKEPRVVCTTSCFHFYGEFDLDNANGEKGRGGQMCLQYYMNNKLWLQTWLCEFQDRLLQHEHLRHITVNGCHPGYVNTGVWNFNKPGHWGEKFVQGLASVAAIDAQQGSLAILHVATSDEAGPNPYTQGIGKPSGKGGGRYFNRIWDSEAMPHTYDTDCRLRVWRKVNEELKLQERGLLDTLGLYVSR